MEEKFKDFLEENGVKEEYFENIVHYKDPETFLFHRDPIYYLSEAFPWDTGLRGKDFWEDLHHLWFGIVMEDR